MASPPMGGSRSCHRQTCTASRTVSGLAVLISLCASFLDAGRTSHRKQFVYYSRAAVSVPFRRLPTHSTVSVIFPPFALAGRISTFGLDMAYHRPTHIPDAVPFALAKPSAFHQHSGTCQPTILCKLPYTPH
ncbi:MAG: hypothetical protein J6W13_01560 [Salinivirgaceae bacterium]|nr:hypothetical protein [Salinivirgaceae bacterium]